MTEIREIPKLLRNGAEPMRLSAKALASASYKQDPHLTVEDYRQQAEWLADQVRGTYLKTVRECLEADTEGGTSGETTTE